MRLKTLILAAAIALVAAGFSRAEGAGDPLSGQWDVSFFIEGRTTPATFTLGLHGDTLSGTAFSKHTGAGTLRDGTFKDDHVAFTLDFSAHESIKITGALKDGQLAGEFQTEGRVGKWEGRKKK